MDDGGNAAALCGSLARRHPKAESPLGITVAQISLTFEPGRRFTVGAMELMRVSELAVRSGVPATTLRYYEDRGLLPAQRSPSGYRLYDRRALDRLAFISAAKQLGLDLDEIRELTVVWSKHSCATVRATLKPRLDQRLAQTRTRMAELAEFQTLLVNARDRLARLPDRDAPCDPGCEFLTSRDLTDFRRTSPAPSVRTNRADRWRSLLSTGRPTRQDGGCSWSLPSASAESLAALAAECSGDFPVHLSMEFHADSVQFHVRLDPTRPVTPGGTAETVAALLGIALDTTEQPKKVTDVAG